MKFTAAEDNVYRAVAYFLKINKVKVTSATIREKLWFHPEFPRLTSVSDVLDELHVPNMSAHLTPDMLETIPLPALAFLNVDGGILAPVKTVANGEIEWLHTNYGFQKESIHDFSQKWTGVTVLTEQSLHAGEPDYQHKRKVEILNSLRIPVLVLGLLASIISVYFYATRVVEGTMEPAFYSMAGLKIAGAIISFMLVWYSLDSSGSFLRSICQLNSKTSCSTILESRGARLLGFINWSEIGLVYFSGTLLVLLMGLITGHVAALMPWIMLLNLAALPYTMYSIYYQAVVAKQWCVLCVAVQLILWGEFLVSFGYQETHLLTFSVRELLIFSMVFPAATLLWIIIRKGLIAELRLPPVQRTLQRLKFDTDYVHALLNKQRYIPPIFEGMKTGRLGNPDATNTLILVTNPACEACARLHREIEEVLSQNADLQFQFVFAASSAPDDEAGLVARKILSLPETEMPGALARWFAMKNKNLNQWEATLPDSATDGRNSDQLQMHLRWVELAGVTNTPFLFLNGIEFTRMYAVSEVPKLCRQFQLMRI